MELVDKGEVIKIINKHLMAYDSFDSETELFTSMMEGILDMDGVESSSTPQSVVNFFIDEEQAKKYISTIVKTDADNQIKFVNYYG